MLQSLFHLLLWIVCAQFLAVLFLPCSRKAFEEFPDKGDGLALPAALLIYVLFSWWCTSTFFDFSTALLVSIITCFFIAWLIAIKWCQLTKGDIKLFMPNRHTLFSLLLFVSVALCFAMITGMRPNIEGTEKLSDFHFLQACFDTKRFPPQDTWLAGYVANYYYFGFIIFSTLGKLCNTPPEIAYNLGIIFVPALTATALFSFARSFSGSKSTAIISVVWVLFLGNIYGFADIIWSFGESNLLYWRASRAVQRGNYRVSIF